MTFAYPPVLLALLLPLLWVVRGWPKSARRTNLLLKAIAISTIIIALAQPVLTLPGTKTGVVVLVDTSLSVTDADLRHASSLIDQMHATQGRNWMKVVPFAAETRNLSGAEASGGLHLLRAGTAANGTNLESALTSSMAAFPTGLAPRLVLMSDGNANEGSTSRAIAELRSIGAPVDTIPLSGRAPTTLRLLSLSMPAEAYAGEQLPIDLEVSSPEPVAARVELSADGKSLGSNPVSLKPGANQFRVHARISSAGVISIEGKIAAGRLGELPFEQAVRLNKARVLYVSGDPAGSDANLLAVFDKAQYDILRDPGLLDGDLSNIQLVVLNNLDLNQIDLARKKRIEEFVKSGGGLLLIAGERQVYKEDAQMDALDRSLPAKLSPPKTPEGTSVALIVDKSSSMEGRKIELARLSAVGVVDHLRPIDSIGVLIFDNSFQWAVPMRRAEDKSLIKRLISGITPDGGTQIAPALAEAYRRVLPSKATYKHIVLLTDGISEEGDSIDIAKEALQHQVTISTVGLGQDVNRTYLEKVAATSGGRSYFLNEPQGLEQILLKDVQEYSGSTAVERSLEPIVKTNAEIVKDVGLETAPALKGYVRFTSKPEAETILSIDRERMDPLYVRWQYGLGRAAVFASDAKSRWAENWVNWPGFDKFWINATRDLLSHTSRSEATAHMDAAAGDLVVDYRLSDQLVQSDATPDVFVLGPDKFEHPIPIRKLSERSFEGRIHIGSIRGLFRIRPVHESAIFPEVGLYRHEEELQDFGTNEALLRQVSAWTGGRFNPSPDSVFDPGNRIIYRDWQLWPALLAFAIAFTIAELIIRKWSGIRQRFSRPA